MTYIEWIESLGDDCDDISPLLAWTEGHKAGRDAEKERITSLIADIGTSGRNECWDCCETILEKIDE